MLGICCTINCYGLSLLCLPLPASHNYTKKKVFYTNEEVKKIEEKRDGIFLRFSKNSWN